jgi:gliding motility-associated-like protein
MIYYRNWRRLDLRRHCSVKKPVGISLQLRYILLLIFIISGSSLFAQCPANLGFEMGTFNKWTCFSGRIDTVARGFHVADTEPLSTRHTIFKNSKLKDRFGGFPVNCPNSSNYSIRLGNDSTGAQIDGARYTLTIPADKDVYSVIYNYAVVLQNPNHAESQQPRFTAKVFDVGTNQYITCSSFDFAASSSLPGFKLSTTVGGANTSVYYKPWSPVTIKLVGYAGKTLQLEFTVNDCTLGGHFGYAYLDINEDCASPISGNIFCLGAKSTVLTGPFGFKEYKWYNADFTNLLGSENYLVLDPVPAANTIFALEVYPYPGSGCVDTLYTKLEYSPVPFQFNLPDSVGACPPEFIDLTASALTAGSSPNLKFSYYTDLSQVNYVPVPKEVSSSGTYFIKAANLPGCIDLKPISVIVDSTPRVKVIDPPAYYYPDKADITNPSLIIGSTNNISFDYWKNAAATIPVPNPATIEIPGTYYIQSTSKFGCSLVSPVQVAIQIPPPSNAFSPNNDGINDTWLIPALVMYPKCKVDIYDRYGRLVFRSVGYDTPWDGKINGKWVPVGTYYYMITASEKLSAMTGSVTVIH